MHNCDDMLRDMHHLTFCYFDEVATHQVDLSFWHPLTPGALLQVVRLSQSATSSAVERGSYGIAVDVWTAGILAYELLLGGPPFEADTKEETYQRILTAEPQLPSHWDEPARDFVRQVTKGMGLVAK